MDLKKYFQLLDTTTKETIHTVHGLHPASLNSSIEGKWSPIQQLEHIYLVEKVCFSIVSKPSAALSEKVEMYGEEKLKKILVDRRDRKVEAPNMLHPTEKVDSLELFEKIFTEQRKNLKQELESGKIIVDSRIHNHPFLGEMTISDWLYFMIHHTQRHLEQIKELVHKQD